MRGWRIAPLLLACLLAGSDGLAADPSSGLRGRLDAALGHRGLRGATLAVLVVDAADGGVIYEREPDRALVPASNLKVLTAVAALDTLGPAHRFETELRATSPPDADGGVEHLYVRGGGDPALTSEDLWRLAADLRRHGLRHVSGDLVLDASLYDDERWHPSWGRVSSRAYNAPVGALTVNYGAFAVRVRPGAQSGDALRVSIDPPVPFLELVDRGRTLSPRARQTLVVDRRTNGQREQVRVEGGLRAGAEPETLYRSVADPVLYMGSVLRYQLAALGIRIEGATRRGVAPADAAPLFAFSGRPLAEILRRFLKYSNNSIGEGLVKALGARAGVVPAGWDAGIARVREVLADLGVPLDGVVLRDGSGLSYENRVPPRAFVAALRLARTSFRFGPEFVSALPIAAADGTLEERAEASAEAVRAKTGSLTGVTGLSGYARLADGRTAVFSLLVNGYRRGTEDAWAGVDGFLEELSGPTGGGER